MANLRTCEEKVLSLLWEAWIRWKGCAEEILFKWTLVTGETIRRNSNVKNPKQNVSKTWMTVFVVSFPTAACSQESGGMRTDVHELNLGMPAALPADVLTNVV